MLALSKRTLGSLVRRRCPAWSARALLPDGSLGQVNSRDMAGDYWLLFFYPLDFTFVCPTELLAFAQSHHAFVKAGCRVVGGSVDSEYAHRAWTRIPREDGGLGGPLPFPLIADVGGRIARRLGVLATGDEEENDDHDDDHAMVSMPSPPVALRATLIFDRDGMCRHVSVNDAPVGRSIDEALRLLQAIQYADRHAGLVCPAGWQVGQTAIDTANPGQFFEKSK